MLELNKVAELIQKAIAELGTERKKLPELIEHRARTESEYDKQIALAMVKLEGGKPVFLDDVAVTSTTATNLEKKAKAVCSEYRYKMLLAEGKYKACVTNIECLKAQLNGFQSLYKGQIEV
jgi:hypothetical protein